MSLSATTTPLPRLNPPGRPKPSRSRSGRFGRADMKASAYLYIAPLGFLWPRAVLTPDHPTLQVSLGFISTGYYTDYPMVFAATAVATLPLVVVFAVFGRQIIGGIMEGAIKA